MTTSLFCPHIRTYATNGAVLVFALPLIAAQQEAVQIVVPGAVHRLGLCLLKQGCVYRLLCWVLRWSMHVFSGNTHLQSFATNIMCLSSRPSPYVQYHRCAVYFVGN